MIGEEGEPAEGLSSPSSTLSLAASFDLSCFFFRGSCVHVILVRCGKKVKTTKREHVAVLPVQFFY